MLRWGGDGRAVEDVIYLDNAATMPLCPPAREAVAELVARGLTDANPSSPHRAGRRVRARLDRARDTVAELLGASPREIVFTSGGTESDNLGLRGAARAMLRQHGRRGVVVSAIEHHAVLEAARALSQEGFAVELAPCSRTGVVSSEAVAQALERLESAGHRPAVVALMLVNNEVGTVQPVAEVAELAHRHGALAMVDAVQGAFLEGLDVGRLGCDLLALSAHKFGGPQGAGALYVRRGVPFEPILFGGGQEAMLRPGTENVVGIVGMAAALAWARESRASVEAHKERLERLFLARLAERLPQVELNTGDAPRSPGLMSLHVPGVEAEALLVALDMAGVACSYGAACSSGSLRASHVLKAMGLDHDRVRCSIRVSIGPFNTPQEVEQAACRLAETAARLGAAGALAGAPAGVSRP